MSLQTKCSGFAVKSKNSILIHIVNICLHIRRVGPNQKIKPLHLSLLVRLHLGSFKEVKELD